MFKDLKFTLSALIMALIPTVYLFAQPTSTEIGDVVMPSPEVAAMANYSDVPIGYHTGVPQIGVPIHTLTEGPLSLPVSLSYHAGGVPVAQSASWTGTNWTLVAGGSVNRSDRGVLDDESNGYYFNGNLDFTNQSVIHI